MDLFTFTSAQTSAFARDLIGARTERSLRHIQALREALDAAARDLAAQPPPEAQVEELALKLAGAADAEIRRMQEQAAAGLEAAQRQAAEGSAEAARVAAALAQAEAEAAVLRSELQTARERLETVERDLSLTVDAHAEVEASLRGADAEARQLSQRIGQLTDELSEAQATAEQLREEEAALRAALDRASTERSRLEEQVAVLQRAIEEERRFRAEGEAASHRDVSTLEMSQRQLSDHVRLLEGTIQEMTRTEAQLRDELAARQRALETQVAAAAQAHGQREALAAEVETLAGDRGRLLAERDGHLARLQALESTVQARDLHIRDLQARADRAERTAAPRGPAAATDQEGLRSEIDRMMSLFDASTRALAEMSAAASSTELLGELVKRLSLQFSRVAWFRLKGNRLEGEHQLGFEDTGDVTKLVMPLTVDSLLTRAVASGAEQSMQGPDVSVRTGTPFGGTPTSAVALPIAVNGTTLGVLYADDSEMPEAARGAAVHESSVGYARLLAGQVAVLLVRHTHELKTLAELRHYAATLLQEARAMHQADLEGGRTVDQIRSRLKENIDCASQLYAYRAAMEGTAAAALLDDQIAEELNGSTRFAQDLAAVVAEMNRREVGLTAEAS